MPSALSTIARRQAFLMGVFAKLLKFVIALALWSLERFRATPGWAHALTFTGAVTYAALLRPDGALVGVALAPAMLAGLNPRRAVHPLAGGAVSIHRRLLHVPAH